MKTIKYLILIHLILSALFADTWKPPKTEKYYSKDRKYYLKVIPGCCVNKKAKPCRGILYENKTLFSDKKIWEITLDNNVAPLNVILANNKKFIITFDNWGEKGYGDNVIVIYDEKGRLKKKFSLEDVLTKPELSTIPVSISSRWWGEGHYIDEINGILVLRVNTMPADEDAEFKEVKIDLKTFDRLD